MAGLLKFLQDSRDTEFAWGTTDCVQWVCSYIQQTIGVNPGEMFTNTYNDEIACESILHNGCGLLNLTIKHFEIYSDKITFELTSECIAGNIYIVSFGGSEYMAIGTRGGWAIKKLGRGFHILNRGVKVLGAWSLRSEV